MARSRTKTQSPYIAKKPFRQKLAKVWAYKWLYLIQNPDKYTLQLRLRSLLFGEELNNSSANLEGMGTQVMTQSLKMATVAVSTIPILVVYPWLQKYFVKGVMIGSVKG